MRPIPRPHLPPTTRAFPLPQLHLPHRERPHPRAPLLPPSGMRTLPQTLLPYNPRGGPFLGSPWLPGHDTLLSIPWPFTEGCIPLLGRTCFLLPGRGPYLVRAWPILPGHAPFIVLPWSLHPGRYLPHRRPWSHPSNSGIPPPPSTPFLVSPLLPSPYSPLSETHSSVVYLPA